MKSLLLSREPDPVGVYNIVANSPWLFLCEHASKKIPLSLEQLGLADSQINRHIGWDIGILDLTKELVSRLNAPLIFQQYSRLVIDCNRPLNSPDLIPVSSEDTQIPGNRDLDVSDREKRINGIWKPYQDYIKNYFIEKKEKQKMVVSMHSFTPVFKGESRPWHIGLLYNRDPRMALALKKALEKYDHSVNIGMNQPYTVSDEEDYTVPEFGEATGLPHVLIEIRQDLINNRKYLAQWIVLFTMACRDLENIFIEGKNN